jgi:hypothetical protein
MTSTPLHREKDHHGGVIASLGGPLSCPPHPTTALPDACDLKGGILTPESVP